MPLCAEHGLKVKLRVSFLPHFRVHTIEAESGRSNSGGPNRARCQSRLALLSLLAGVEEAEFTWLRNKTGSTDGNLGAQLLKLEEAGYMRVKKKFVQRKPRTNYRITEDGRRALAEYVRALRELLGPAVDGEVG